MTCMRGWTLRSREGFGQAEERVRMFSMLERSMREMEMLMNKRIKREKDGRGECCGVGRSRD